MNKRLLKIASMIQSEIGVIDVGTDHGYLPAFLAKSGFKANIIASDINPSPLQTAINTAREEGLESRIRFLLSDGLDLCPPDEVDCIVVAGMGGDTICGILDRAAWCMDSRYQLILQPVTKPEILRYWLAYNGFDFIEDTAVEDNGIIYQIISVRFGGGISLSDAELFIGSYELVRYSDYFMPQLEKLILRFNKAVAGLSMSNSSEDISRKNFYASVLDQLINMKMRHMDT